MPSEVEINTVLDSFLACLTLQARSILYTLPRNALDQEQYNILHQYSQHFGGTESSAQQRPAPSRPGSNTADGSGEEDPTNSNVLLGTGQPAKKLRGRLPKNVEKSDSHPSKVDSSESRYVIRNLKRVILEPTLRDHLEDPPYYARRTGHHAHAMALPGAFGWGHSLCYVRQGTKISEKHKDDFMKAAGTEENARSSYAVLAAGWNVAFICDKLGTGNLFWLSMTLTANSITHRVTKAGGAFDEAMRKLQSLKLAEHIEQSGANLLSDAISAYLVKMEAGKARLYKNALVGRNSALEDSRPYYH